MKRWSKEDIEFLKENYLKYGYRELSEIMERSFISVKSKIFDLGLSKKPRYADENLDMILNSSVRELVCLCIKNSWSIATCSNIRFQNGIKNDPVKSLVETISSQIDRCTNPKNHKFKNYGARGIKVCPNLSSNMNEYALYLLNIGWAPGLQVDRTNNDGDYEIGNLRIVSAKDNSNNRSVNKHVSAFGETKTVAQWSEDPRCVVKYFTLMHRINRKNEMTNEEKICLNTEIYKQILQERVNGRQ